MSLEMSSAAAAAAMAPDRRQAPCHRAAGAVSVMMQVPLRDIMGRTRKGRAPRARQIAMYVANVVFGVAMSECARAFGRDRSTVSYACKRVEDERDDPHLDQRLEALERLIRDEGAADTG